MLDRITPRSIAFAILVIGPALTFASEPDVPETNGGVALIDMGYIFDHHPEMIRVKLEIKADIEREDTQVRNEQENLNRLAETYKDRPPATPTNFGPEGEVQKRAGELRITKNRRRDYLCREAEIYLRTYQDVEREVGEHAKAHGLSVVIRFNDTPVDVDIAESIIAFVNRPVVWHDPKLNITQPDLDRILKKHKANEDAAKPPSNSVTPGN